MSRLEKPFIYYWADPAGKRVPPNTPGAQCVKKQAKKWYAVGPPLKRGERVALATDRKVADRERLKLDAARYAIKHGTATPEASYRAHEAVPLSEHLAIYRARIESRGGTADHVKQTIRRITSLCEDCRFETLSDINGDAVIARLAAMRLDAEPITLPQARKSFRPGEVADLLGIKLQGLYKITRTNGICPTGRGKAARYDRATVEALLARAARGTGLQTTNYYLGAMKGFCKWLVKSKRLRESPVEDLESAKTHSDIRHARRALDMGEIDRLLTAARASRVVFQELSGTDRAYLYIAAAATTLRAHELSVLWPESFVVKPASASATLPSSVEKNRKGTKQSIKPEVLAILAPYLAGRPRRRPIWPGRWYRSAAAMLRIDLAAAGIPYEIAGPEGPLYADFHALRHSGLTIAAEFMSIKELQAFARHADVRQTMRYVHADNLDAAVARLPTIGAPNTQVIAAEFVSLPAADYAALRGLAAAALVLLGGEMFASTLHHSGLSLADISGNGRKESATTPG